MAAGTEGDDMLLVDPLVEVEVRLGTTLFDIEGEGEGEDGGIGEGLITAVAEEEMGVDIGLVDVRPLLELLLGVWKSSSSPSPSSSLSESFSSFLVSLSLLSFF